jgi:CBS domain-containing protein
MVGAALGGAEALAFPAAGPGFWPLISMGAVLAGTMRAPLTAVIFALELTHDITVLLPLLIATAISYSVTVLVMKRSILTEKISRRGYHLSCEYAVDPLEIIFAREVARQNVASLPIDVRPGTAAGLVDGRRQRLLPVVDRDRRLVGVITRSQLDRWILEADPETSFETVVDRRPAVAQETEPLRSIASRMAETGVTRMPVVTRDGTLVGIIALKDLLTARTRLLEAERRRERVLGTGLRMALFGRGRQEQSATLEAKS